MNDFVALDFDPNFCNFNFCSLWDPALRPGSGPSESSLYKLAYLGRRGEVSATGEYADTMGWTLRPEAFECFQRTHGPRPIRYEHWFYAKLQQLLSIFLYDELLVYGMGANGATGRPRTNQPWKEGTGVLTGTPGLIQDSRLEKAYSPDDSGRHDWMLLLRRLLANAEDRGAEFERILDEQIREREQSGIGSRTLQAKTATKRRTRNAERNSIIINCLDRGDDREEICRVLDRKGIETTPQMRRCKVNRWSEAWEDPEFHNNVQQLITKAKTRHNRVKS